MLLFKKFKQESFSELSEHKAYGVVLRILHPICLCQFSFPFGDLSWINRNKDAACPDCLAGGPHSFSVSFLSSAILLPLPDIQRVQGRPPSAKGLATFSMFPQKGRSRRRGGRPWSASVPWEEYGSTLYQARWCQPQAKGVVGGCLALAHQAATSPPC